MGSSNFFAFERLLRHALKILEDESPSYNQWLALATRELIVSFEMDSHVLTLGSDGLAIWLTRDQLPANVRLRLTLTAMRALLCGETSLISAIRERAIDVFGSVRMLDHAARAMEIVVHGLVRAASANALAIELRAATEELRR